MGKKAKAVRCGICKQLFRQTHALQKYCGEECKRKKLIINVHNHKLRYDKLYPKKKNCLVCDSEYFAIHGRQKYCSKNCSDKEAEKKKELINEYNRLISNEIKSDWKTMDSLRKKVMNELDEENKKRDE